MMRTVGRLEVRASWTSLLVGEFRCPGTIWQKEPSGDDRGIRTTHQSKIYISRLIQRGNNIIENQRGKDGGNMLFKNPVNGRNLSPTLTLLFECDTQTQVCLQQKTLLYKIAILEFSDWFDFKHSVPLLDTILFGVRKSPSLCPYKCHLMEGSKMVKQ